MRITIISAPASSLINCCLRFRTDELEKETQLLPIGKPNAVDYYRHILTTLALNLSLSSFPRRLGPVICGNSEREEPKKHFGSHQ